MTEANTAPLSRCKLS